ncbi:hypothetical protein Tsubulata_001623, partial [Turnera subulata]
KKKTRDLLLLSAASSPCSSLSSAASSPYSSLSSAASSNSSLSFASSSFSSSLPLSPPPPPKKRKSRPPPPSSSLLLPLLPLPPPLPSPEKPSQPLPDERKIDHTLEDTLRSQRTSKHQRSKRRELCPRVKNVLLLDSAGRRVASKYYSDDWPTNSAKEAFEKAVFAKTQKTNARTEVEITMFENYIVVYKVVQDLHFFVTGGEDENELILAAVLEGFFDAVGLLLRGNVDKNEALGYLDLILLCLDEIVDGGIILETDANVIAGKVAGSSADMGAPLSEQTLSQAFATAREHITRSLLS